MKLSRPFQLFAGLVAAISLLFMQFAIASYVCPGMAPGNGNEMASINQMRMAGCDGMDTAQPALCHATAYDHTSKPSLDKPELPHVPAFVPARLMQVVEADGSTSSLLVAQPVSRVLTRTTAPPIAIRNCCFRI